LGFLVIGEGNPVEILWRSCGNPVEILWRDHMVSAEKILVEK